MAAAWFLADLRLFAQKPATLATATGEGWTTASPRDELRPEFAFHRTGGRDGKGSWAIRADQRAGLDGYWVKSFPISGDRHSLSGK